MSWFDLPEHELRSYRTATEEPEGLDAWWQARLDQAREAASPPTLERYAPDAYGPVTVYDVSFSGAHGDRIRAWLLLPPSRSDRSVPAAVTFIGYGGGRGVAAEHLVLPATGIAAFVMDTRG